MPGSTAVERLKLLEKSGGVLISRGTVSRVSQDIWFGATQTRRNARKDGEWTISMGVPGSGQ